jgi:excisionase family DNA binding protein
VNSPSPTGASAHLERLLTVPEVAEFLRCTPDYVYRLVRRGEIAAVKNGRRVLVAPTGLSDYMHCNRTNR